jgi:C4-dicarboxylate-specific signal transduction histidine kinase
MSDLKVENLRLQKLADILDSQLELTFCCNKNGHITFMSDSAFNFMKSTSLDDSDEDPTHISQILTGGSVSIVLAKIVQIRGHQCKSLNDADPAAMLSPMQVGRTREPFPIRIRCYSCFEIISVT